MNDLNLLLQKTVNIAGSPGKLAKKINQYIRNFDFADFQRKPVTRYMVSRWINISRIPAEYVLAVEYSTGVPRYDLRPDIYPRDEYELLKDLEQVSFLIN